MVTSSAVVGSSARRIFGLHESAMAIIARCRMPPESWWGYSRTLWRGRGMPTRSSISAALSIASFFFIPWWSMTASAIWKPMVNTGFKLVIGSWKIIEM